MFITYVLLYIQERVLRSLAVVIISHFQ